MKYVKKVSVIPTEYQGESFAKALGKTSGLIWDANEIGTYEVVDGTGTVVSSGALSKSIDNLSLIVVIPASDTSALLGDYLLLVHLNDSIDAEFSDVIGEYKMSYKERKA